MPFCSNYGAASVGKEGLPSVPLAHLQFAIALISILVIDMLIWFKIHLSICQSGGSKQSVLQIHPLRRSERCHFAAIMERRGNQVCL
jgi:hypothetical protein